VVLDGELALRIGGEQRVIRDAIEERAHAQLAVLVAIFGAKELHSGVWIRKGGSTRGARLGG
jgi:hypothetical protein